MTNYEIAMKCADICDEIPLGHVTAASNRIRSFAKTIKGESDRLMAEREQLVAALRAFDALADNCLCDDAYDMRKGMEAIRADISNLLRQIEGAV